MDNNVLASDHGIQQMESMIGQKVRIDFNQGMDARLVTPEIAEIISRLKWIRCVRFSCDTDAVLDRVIQTIELLGKKGMPAYKIFVYCLVTDDLESAERRVLALRSAGVDPFAMPYRDYTNSTEPTPEMKKFARWVNRKEVFKTVERFSDYKRKGGAGT